MSDDDYPRIVGDLRQITPEINEHGGHLFCLVCKDSLCQHICALVLNEQDAGWPNDLSRITVPMFLKPPATVVMYLSVEDSRYLHWLMDVRDWKKRPEVPLEGFIEPGESRLRLRDAVLTWLISQEEVRCTSDFHVARIAPPLEKVGLRHPKRLANVLATMQTGHCLQCLSIGSVLIPEVDY